MALKYKIASKIVSSMEKIFLDREPINGEYHTTALLGEVVNFQLAYNNGSENTPPDLFINVRGELADVTAVKNIEFVPATNVPTKYADDYYLGGIGLYPDILCPLEKRFCLGYDVWKAFYVSVNVNESIKSGKYTLFFDLVTPDGEVINTLAYTLKVIGVKADKPDIPLTNWMHYDCIAEYYGVEVFSDEWYDIFVRYLDSYTHCGFNMLLIPIFTPPLDTLKNAERGTCQLVNITYANGKYAFDFSDLEFFLRFSLKHGVKYFEFCHLFTQWGGEFCPKVMANVNGVKKKIFGWGNRSDSEEYREFLAAFLTELHGFLKKNGWIKNSFMHLTDEPLIEQIDKYDELSAFVRKYVDDIPTIDAVSETEFIEKGIVDIVVPNINSVAAFKQKGFENVWAYYCCSPTNSYYSNRLLNMPLQRTRILGMQLYLNGIKGFLHWGYNFYNAAGSRWQVDPYRDTSAGGYFPSGDSYIVYPAKNGVNTSLRYEAMREAFQDYALLKSLEKVKGRAFTERLLAEEGIEGFTEYPRSIAWHKDFIEKVKSLLIEENSL